MPWCCSLDQRKPNTICAVLIDQVKGIQCVSCRFGHLAAGRIPHHAVDDDVSERSLVGHVNTEFHHPSDPEEDDIEPGNKRRSGIELREIIRFIRPTECRERP